MRVSQLRDELIAPFAGLTPQVLRQKTDMLYHRPELRHVLPGRRHGGGDNRGLLATPAAAALLILVGMVGGARETVAASVVRLWNARCVTPTGNPFEKWSTTVGAALTLLLQRSDVRDRLLYCQLDRDIPHMEFVFGPADALVSKKPLTAMVWQQRIDDAVKAGELSRTFFAPYPRKEWERRLNKAFEAGEMAHVYRLEPSTLNKIAEKISQELDRAKL